MKIDLSASPTPLVLLIAAVVMGSVFLIFLVLFLRSRSRIKKLQSVCKDLEIRVTEEQKRLSNLTRIDELTGLFNSRSFFEQIKGVIARSHRLDSEASIAVIGISGLIELNEAVGRDNSNEVIKQIAQILNKSVRVGDQVFRFSGSKFCIIMPDTEPDKSEVVCQRFISAYISQAAGKEYEKILKLSLGISASFTPRIKNDEEIVNDALHLHDKAAKMTGHIILTA